MAGDRGGEGAREGEAGIALAADGEVPLLVDEAPGAKVDPARRGHELLRRSVDQLVDRRGGRGESASEEGEGEKAEPEAGGQGPHQQPPGPSWTVKAPVAVPPRPSLIV